MANRTNELRIFDLFEKFFVFFCQFGTIQQFRPPLHCPQQRLLPFPLFDVGVMTGDQHLRYGLAVPFKGLGVLGMLQQAVKVTLL